MSLSEFAGKSFLPKEPLPLGAAAFNPIPWSKAYRVFQINRGRKHNGLPEFYELVIERDHVVVTNEAYGVFEKLLTDPAA